MKYWTIALLLAMTIAGCDLFGDDDENDPIAKSPKVVVANSGNFSDQNGFVTLYDPENKTTMGLENHGAFVHAVFVRGSLAYVVLNTFSVGRVDVLDLDSGNISATVPDLPSPRAIAFMNDDRAMVTNLSAFGANGLEPAIISSLSLAGSPSVSGQTTVGVNPEGIVQHDGTFFVANNGNIGDGTTLSVIDGATGDVVDTIELGCDGPNEIFADDEGQIVVVCEGKTVYSDDFTEILEQTAPQVVFLASGSKMITGRIVLERQIGSANFSQSAFLAEGSGELYVIATASDVVMRFDTRTRTLQAEIDVPAFADLTGLTAVAYDATDDLLYLGRLALGAGGFPDFTSAGAVVILNRSGQQVGRFATGPAPSHIDFQRDE